MAQSSRRFNEGEDAFWDHVDEVLTENEEVMMRVRRPGEIGSVAITPLYREWFGDELPPDDIA